MREYLNVNEASKLIATEVIETGKSPNWLKADSNNLNIAVEVERHLSSFNIGLVDPRRGVWGKCSRGSRYFTSMNLFSSVKSGLNSIIGTVKDKTSKF